MNFLSRPVHHIHRSADGAVSHDSHDGMLAACSQASAADACAKVASTAEGLSEAEAAARLQKFGPNLVASERKPTIPEEIWSRARNPLNALLLTLAVISWLLG